VSPIAFPQGELHLRELISLHLFECISPIENVVCVVLAQMALFNPKSLF
jgi:hypothetical protein